MYSSFNSLDSQYLQVLRVDRVGAVRRWEQNVTGVTLATQCARLVTAAAQQWLTSRADRLLCRAAPASSRGSYYSCRTTFIY